MSEQQVPVVPVAGFWANRSDLGLLDITRALENGRLRGFKRVIITTASAEALTKSLGIELHADVLEGDIAAVERAVSRGALGLVGASEVSPRCAP